MRYPLQTAAILVSVITVITLGVGPTSDEPVASEVSSPAEAMPTAEAIDLFTGRVESNRGDIVSQTILGELLIRRFRETADTAFIDEAQTVLETALVALPDYPRAQSALASVFISQHRFTQALELATAAQRADPDGHAILSVGDAQLALGRYEAARQTFLAAHAQFPNPLVRARLARVDEIYGDTEGARSRIDRAAASFMKGGGAGEPAAWLQMRRGDLAFQVGDYAAARDAYSAALDILPDHLGSMAGLGRSLEALGDRVGSIETWEQAARLQPHPEILLALAEMYVVDGQEQQADETFERLAAMSEASTGLYEVALAFYEADYGDPAQAVRTAESLVDTRPDLVSFDALAWASYRNGQLPQARAAADRALATNPGDARFWFHSGVIWAAMGDADRAQMDLSHALSLSPRFDPIGWLAATELIQELSSR